MFCSVNDPILSSKFARDIDTRSSTTGFIIM